MLFSFYKYNSHLSNTQLNLLLIRVILIFWLLFICLSVNERKSVLLACGLVKFHCVVQSFGLKWSYAWQRAVEYCVWQIFHRSTSLCWSAHRHMVLFGQIWCRRIIEVWKCEVHMSHNFQQFQKILYSSQFVAVDGKKAQMFLVLEFTPLTRLCQLSNISWDIEIFFLHLSSVFYCKVLPVSWLFLL